MLPRAGFTLVDAKAKKLLRRYGLTVEGVWAGSQRLRHKWKADRSPALWRKTSSETKNRLPRCWRSSASRSRSSIPR